MSYRALAAIAAVLAVAIPGTPSAALAGVAAIPHLTITPTPAVHATQDIYLQVPGADVSFETATALGKIVGSVELAIPGEGMRSCTEASANQKWTCGDNTSGVVQMRVSYDADSFLVTATTDYTVKVGITNNNPTSAGYGQRNYSSGVVTVNPADVPTSDLKVTSFTRRAATAQFFATIANGGPDKAQAILTFSGYGSTSVVPTGDVTCTTGSAYTCRYTLASGESVQYELDLAGNPANLTLTAKVTSANPDPVPGNNSKTLKLGAAPVSPAPHASSSSASSGGTPNAPANSSAPTVSSASPESASAPPTESSVDSAGSDAPATPAVVHAGASTDGGGLGRWWIAIAVAVGLAAFAGFAGVRRLSRAADRRAGTPE